jgi:Ca2+:H+ antiporter
VGGLRRFLLSGSGPPYLLVPSVPVATVGRATEELATRTRPGIGGVLDVTLGTVRESQLLALYAVLGIVLSSA